MDELLEEFWDWFKDKFEHQHPDSTNQYDYERLFKTFWEEKYYDVWKYEIGEENGCYERHCEIYEPMDTEMDDAYDRYVDEQLMGE